MYPTNDYKVEGNGHVCVGGGATIKDSPVTTNIHIHIHANEASTIQKISRAINGLFQDRHTTIENASQISEEKLSGLLSREFPAGHINK